VAKQLKDLKMKPSLNPSAEKTISELEKSLEKARSHSADDDTKD